MTDRKILRQMRREEEMADILMGIAEGIARGAMAVAILLMVILFIAHSQPEEVQAAVTQGVTAIPDAEELPEMVPLGEYRITWFCSCRKCNGKWAGQPTASGAALEDGVTVAVDRRVIPLGTELYIDGIGYRIAQDTGVRGKSIDVFLDNHSECNRNGIQYRKVWKVNRK